MLIIHENKIMTSKTTKYIMLGKNIKNARKLNHLSQNDLADKLNISREHLAKVETAKKGISLDLLFQIADVLNVKEKDLLDFSYN